MILQWSEAMQITGQGRAEITFRSPCSPNLAPSDFHLSRGKQFTEDTDVKQAVTPSVQTLDTRFSYARIVVQALVPQRDTHFSANDDHVEVWCVPSATHAPYTHRSQNVLGIRALFILPSETPYFLSAVSCPLSQCSKMCLYTFWYLTSLVI